MQLSGRRLLKAGNSKADLGMTSVESHRLIIRLPSTAFPAGVLQPAGSPFFGVVRCVFSLVRRLTVDVDAAG